MAIEYITKMFDRLDRICYAYYGSTANREVEFVLDKNPGLEKQPMVLPPGLKIILPDRPPAPPKNPIFGMVQLWS